MLGRTHEIVSVGAVISAAILFPPEKLTAETAIISVLVALVGGITPDLDKPGSKIWDKVPAGGCLSRLINPFFIGGHRHITHSLLGMLIFGAITRALLGVLPLGGMVDTNIVLWSFLIAFGAHIAADMMTKDGVPVLFPLPFHFGLPPFEFLRMETNGFVEKLVVVPGIILTVIALGYFNHENAIALLRALTAR